MKIGQIIGIILAFALVIGAIITFHTAAYHQDANEICVVQSPISGELTVSYQPGTHWSGGSTITRYPRRGQVEFDSASTPSEGAYQIAPLDIRFNDGAECKLEGAISWEMPGNADQVIKLHKEYGSVTAIEQQLIKKVLEKSVFVTGPTMSSAESYASRRNDMLSLVADQVEHGAYKTISHDTSTLDPITGETKTVRVVSIALDEKGNQLREDQSPIAEFGLHTFGLTISHLSYPAPVEAQIQNQQQAIMAVQTAIAKAKTAEQDALTIEQQGKATAAQSKWEQEAIKAKEVTIAEKNLEVARLTAEATQTNAIIQAQQQLGVATLSALAAEKTKLANIALGEGEAARAKLNMEANGALEQKLEAYKEVNKQWADAVAKYSGNWVPSTAFGGNSTTTAGNGATTLIDLLTAKSARDLSLDMSMTTPSSKSEVPLSTASR